MSLNDVHYDSCPVCRQQFLGFTAADMVIHFIEEHPDLGDRLHEKLGLRKNAETCADCGRDYVTHMGECPWCKHDGPPYK